jgi:Zn-dependent peptidase ImmA (M78 family)
MSYLARNEQERNIIMLRETLSREEKNFTCAHELIHVKFHNNLHIATFQCFDKVRPNQNSILEWQANEGAAELLVPICEFLPIIKENLPSLKTWQDFENFDFGLARYFSTTKGVIKIRYEDLKYEIYQYLNGTPLENIEILSHKMQCSRGIQVESLNDVEDKLWQKEFGIYHIDIVAEDNHVQA